MLSNEYIYQEILEQERIVATHQSMLRPEWPAVPNRLIITGAGDSHCAALFGCRLLEESMKVEGLPALEGSRAAQSLSPQDILMGISVSGRTVRVLEAAERAQAAGAQVVALTDNLESPLAKLATSVWPIYASPEAELQHTDYKDNDAKQYVGYHHDVAQTKTFWSVLLTLIRAAQAELDWQSVLNNTRQMLSASFYQPVLTGASLWARSGQTFFLGSGWSKIAARYATYKMYEFNRIAHFTGIEEYCHTHYFITRTGDTVVFLIADEEAAARAVEIVPVLHNLFDAKIVWLQPQSISSVGLPANSIANMETMHLPAASGPVAQFLDLILALQWLTYFIGRVEAPDINIFHAGYDTERLVAGTLRTIRQSAIRVPGSDKEGEERQ